MAEIERARHINLVEESINDLETKIYQLSERIETRGQASQEEVDKRSHERTEAWLDAAYLKNGLINWQNQLKHMSRHAKELRAALPDAPLQPGVLAADEQGQQKDPFNRTAVEHQMVYEASSKRIIDRIDAIVEEYDEKIRDSSMRLEGMAMATQWELFSL
ncbi:hypothetical protein ACHAQA_000181 [Verticillium albo-atrum]